MSVFFFFFLENTEFGKIFAELSKTIVVEDSCRRDTKSQTPFPNCTQ